MIALDVETLLFRPGMMAPPIVSVATSRPSLEHRSDPWQQGVRAALAGEGIYGHHVAYDSACMMSTDPTLAPDIFRAYEGARVTCTLLRQRLREIASGEYKFLEDEDGKISNTSYSLAACARQMLGVDLDKSSVRLRYSELWDIPVRDWPAAFVDYARGDVDATAALYSAQGAPNADEYRQARGAFWLQLSAVWGVRIDRQRVEQLRATLEADRTALVGDLVRNGLLRDSGTRDTRKAKARMVEAVAEPEMTEGGQVSLSREACENSGDPVLADYAAFSRLNALLNKDIKALADRDLVHTNYTALRETGRTASWGPNLQNFPRKYGLRECIIPRPGNAFVVLDYSGIELATLASACMALLGRSSLRDALNAGRDPHLEIAAQILGEPYENVRAEYKARGPRYEAIGERRQIGKVANFGYPGGLGAKSLVHYAKQSYGVDLTIQQAYHLKETWLATWPEMAEYFRYIDATHLGGVTQLRSGRVRGVTTYCQACNSYFQGLAADMAKDAGFRLAREMYDPTLRSVLYGCRTVLFVHDEYVIEAPISEVDAVARRAEELMLEAAAAWIPDVHVGVEYAACTRYCKGAKATRDQGGRLLVTEVV